MSAIGRSKIEKTLKVPEVQERVTTLSDITERAGFEPAVRKNPHTAFPRLHHRPLGHLSKIIYYGSFIIDHWFLVLCFLFVAARKNSAGAVCSLLQARRP